MTQSQVDPEYLRITKIASYQRVNDSYGVLGTILRQRSYVCQKILQDWENELLRRQLEMYENQIKSHLTLN